MAFFKGFLRVYSWIFETILCLLAIGIATVSLLGGSELQIGWLPWTGRALQHYMILVGVLGLILVLLAVAGRLRFLLFLFSLAVLILLVRGLFMSGYSFPQPDAWKGALLLIMGAILAFIGAWPFWSTARYREVRRRV